MGQKGKLQSYLGGIAGVLVILGLLVLARGNDPVHVNQRADVIRIDLTAESRPGYLPAEAEKTMPAVSFFHDRHTLALEGDTCRACHLTRDDDLVFLFKRLESSDLESDRDVYHAGCIGCHTDQAAAGASSGPLSGNCRGCHSRSPETGSAWAPMIFSHSLHYRHESAELIAPDPDTQTNCMACHHQYDPDIAKTVYVKGEENACLYCHPAQGQTDGRLSRPHRFGTFKPVALPSSTTEESGLFGQPEAPDTEIRFMSAAAHDACVACHLRLSATHDRTTGPMDCAGCHTIQAQKKIRVPETVPRMKRNQPDAVLMAAWLDRDDLIPDRIATEIDPVAFDHKAHEGHSVYSESCRQCHHSALNSCGECHTRKGSAVGGFIGLNQAMHDPESVRTCIGCHLDQTGNRSDCAGCHAAGPRPGFGDRNCQVCHGVDKADMPPPPVAKNEKAELAAAALNIRGEARKVRGTLPPMDQIPERVRIDAMVDIYEAVDLPHRKIIGELDRRMQESGLAQTFHPDPLTMCAGCHHKSPASLKPPKCASCHSPHQTNLSDGRPALMGAYHNQCMGCHQRMEILKPKATDCIECHPKRDKP